MAEKYASILNQTACYSAISFCFSLAQETGIFTTLLSAERPLTSEEIAKENKIKERYAREMLGCLSAIELAKVTTNEDGINVYYFEEAAKDVVMKGDFALAEMCYPRIYMSRYYGVRDNLGADKSGAFRYDRSFMDLVQEHKKKQTPAIVDLLLGSTPGLRDKLEKGIDVIEFGCGNAYPLSVLATMFPKSNFTATEVNSEFLEPIKKRYSHISNLKYDVVDLYAIPEKYVGKTYDLLYVNDVIHDLPHPVTALKVIRGMVKEPDGVYAMVDMAGRGSHLKDVGDLRAAFTYASGTFICLPESFQQEDSEAYGASIGKDTILGFTKEAGFDTNCYPIRGILALYICKPV